MKDIIKKIRTYAIAHKIKTGAVLILLVIGGYYSYKSATAAPAVTKYVVQEASASTVVSSVSGSGQVEAGTSIDVKPNVSENVTKIYVSVGQQVKTGQLLVQLDPATEQKALNQAQLSLESAQLNQEKLVETATSTLLNDQDSVRKDQQSIVDASTTLANAYESGFNDLGGTFVNLQNIVSGLENFVAENSINKGQDNPDAYVSLMPNYLQPAAVSYRNNVVSTYQAAAAAYQSDLSSYHAANQSSNSAALDALFLQTYNTAKTLSDAVKASKDLLDYVVDNYPSSSSTSPLPAITTTFQSNLSGYTTSINGEVNNTNNTINGITNDRNSIVDAQNSLTEASETLAELLAGPSQTDMLSQQISVENAQNSLETAQQNLDDTSVRAPIDGIVSALGATVGEPISSSAVTIVGNGEDATISLNEVDAAKVQLGDKATLTFDAITGLSVAGQVIEIDPVGTVSQGVVTYNVKVGFTDTTNQVKPGMSVTADIVTELHQNVVAVPNAAIKTAGGASYVLEPSSALSGSDVAASASGGIVLPAAPKMVPVTTGLSNDTVTEITSGVSAGDQIITQTIQSSGSSASAPSAAASGLRVGGAGAGALFGGGGGGGFGGGAGSVRVSGGSGVGR